MSQIAFTLTGGSPWGFRMRGGSEFNMPITVDNISPNGKAWRDGLQVGDVIISADGQSLTGVAHQVARSVIMNSKDTLKLVVIRGSTPTNDSSTNKNDTSISAPRTINVTQVVSTEPEDLRFNSSPTPYRASLTNSEASSSLPTAYSPKPSESQTKVGPNSQHQQQSAVSEVKPASLISSPKVEATVPEEPEHIYQLNKSVPDSSESNRSSLPRSSPPPPVSAQQSTSRPIASSTPPLPSSQPDTQSSSTTSGISPLSKTTITAPADPKRCAGCGDPIQSGNHVKVGDRCFHPEHFNCHYCKKNMVSVGFFEEDHKIVCKECYGDLFSAKCAVCLKPCVSEYVTTSNRSFHTSCFLCFKCKKSLCGVSFNFLDGNVHCIECITDISCQKCDGCGKKITPGQEFIEAMNKVLHDTCFKCSICSAALGRLPKYMIKNGQACCPDHVS